MAHFTIELRDLLEHTGGKWGVEDYPIFDETYRATLNGNLERHFHYREIGFETIDMFRHQVDAKMRLVMPYYNKLYESERIKFDPLHTVDMTSILSGKSLGTQQATQHTSSNSTTTADATSTSRNKVFPDSPIYSKGDYSTDGSESGSTSTSTGQQTDERTDSGTTTTEGESTSRSYGRSQSPTGLLQQYRAALLNIDQMVIAELEPLFFQVLTTSDGYIGSDLSLTYWTWFTRP